MATGTSFGTIFQQLASLARNEPPEPNSIPTVDLSALGVKPGVPTPPPPPGKGAMFKQLLSEYMQNVGFALSQSGTGPGANARAFGLAIAAPFIRERQDRDFAMQQEEARSLAAQRAANTAAIQQQNELIGVPDPENPERMIEIRRRDLPTYNAARLRLVGQREANVSRENVAKTQAAAKVKLGEIQTDARRGLYQAQEELARARAQVAQGQVDPNSPAFQLKLRDIESRIAERQSAIQQQRERLHLSTKIAQQRGGGITSPTRTMAEAAPKVVNFVSRLRPIIEREANGLGPLGGRWSEFMAGKIGAPNTEYTRLRTDIGLLTTLLMRMHVGARGGQQLLQHFKSLMDVSKQSPENLLAALEEVERYAKDVGSMVEQPATGTGGAPTPAARFKAGDTVMYQGQPRKVRAVRPDGKLELEP